MVNVILHLTTNSLFQFEKIHVRDVQVVVDTCVIKPGGLDNCGRAALGGWAV